MSLLANSNAIESGGYNIDRSLRFRSSASAYLNRTFSTPTSNYIWTWSTWVKRSTLGTDQTLFGVAAGNSGNTGSTPRGSISWDAANTLSIFANDGSTTFLNIVTTPVFRDASAWYHVMFVLDTTQATNTNRVKIYINGVQQTVTGTYPNQNVNTIFNGTSASKYHSLGMYANLSQFADGYLTEINFIDGQALTPSSFGQTDPVTGVWTPKKYTGTYGTNGFYLPFSDNTSATTLAYDKSGNSNNWTPNNISTTAGATYDSMTDVPTLTSDTVANYAVLNPLDQTNQTVSGANLNTVSTGSAGRIRSTMGVSSGKWYFEHTLTAYSAGGTIGVMNINKTLGSGDIGASADEWGYLTNTGAKYNNGSNTSYGSSSTTNDIVMCALDLDNGKIWWGKNGTWFASGDPVAGTNAAFTNVTGYTVTPAVGLGNGSSQSWAHNFGQRPFSYTPPSGFKALNTFNLPDSTIKAGNKYMDATTYTGDGVSGRSITNAAGFQPDLVWVKDRSSATFWNVLFDSVRGAGNQLSSNVTDAELASASSAGGKVSAFNSNGYSVAVGSSNIFSVNGNGDAYVGWQWQAGKGTTSSNTSGSITSTVSVSTTAGFSVVTYTGTGSAGTIGHGLGVAPKMIIVKSRDQGTTGYTGNWYVYHASNTSAPETDYLLLNTTAATADDTFWNDTAPTSTVFSVGALSGTNDSSDKFVAYCWAEIAGFSKFGSYTGNGSTDGPFVFTNFKPAYVMAKRTDTTGNWLVMDSARNTYNVLDNQLYPNLSAAEATASSAEDFLSNGFKLRNTGSDFNASGGTYIYMAFASNPFKYSLGR